MDYPSSSLTVNRIEFCSRWKNEHARQFFMGRSFVTSPVALLWLIGASEISTSFSGPALFQTGAPQHGSCRISRIPRWEQNGPGRPRQSDTASARMVRIVVMGMLERLTHLSAKLIRDHFAV